MLAAGPRRRPDRPVVEGVLLAEPQLVYPRLIEYCAIDLKDTIN